MNSDMAWGIVRALLASAGGYFVSKGVLSSDVMNSVIGAIGVIFAAAWSVIAKMGTGTSVKTAVAAEAAGGPPVAAIVAAAKSK